MSTSAESIVRVSAMTASGEVVGREKSGAVLFAGIPYAAPPIGALRFRAAAPHPVWEEPRDALKFGPAAPQIPSGGLTDSAPVRWHEDCLTLNVTTPAVDAAARPVLVWVHGGHYRTGQSSIPWYNGTNFAKQHGVVVVSINYRLGALGFTDLSRFGEDFATSGVNGTLDQITALSWVRDNIANFGGDPARVTIAGESAGGFSVTTLLGCPAADGLFRGVIAQSGAAHNTLTARDGAVVADRFLTAMQLDSEPNSATAILAASVDDILSAQLAVDKIFNGAADAQTGDVPSLSGHVAPFYPVVGNAVLDRSTLSSIDSGHNARVPVLTGSNRHETTLFGLSEVSTDKLAHAAEKIGDASLLPVYRSRRPNATNEELMIALTTDHQFRIPAIRLAEMRAAHGGHTWLYQFDWESRGFGGRLGATHALEIPFAFDNLGQAGVDAFLGPGPTPQALATEMHAVWAQFIHQGCAPWPEYTTSDRSTMHFNEQSELMADAASAEREAWNGLR